MALQQSIYDAVVDTELQRVVQIPAVAAGFNLVSDGAAVAGAYMANFTTIVAVTTVAVVSSLVGIILGVPAVEAFSGDIVIAIGGAGAEISIATVKVGTNVFPVAEWAWPFIRFGGTSGIKLIGQPRLSFNIRKTTGVSLAGFTGCSLVVVNNIG